jgi:hypothetical protein
MKYNGEQLYVAFNINEINSIDEGSPFVGTREKCLDAIKEWDIYPAYLVTLGSSIKIVKELIESPAEDISDHH